MRISCRLQFSMVDSPALHWLFRDWQVQDVGVLAPDATPELIITPSEEFESGGEIPGRTAGDA